MSGKSFFNRREFFGKTFEFRLSFFVAFAVVFFYFGLQSSKSFGFRRGSAFLFTLFFFVGLLLFDVPVCFVDNKCVITRFFFRILGFCVKLFEYFFKRYGCGGILKGSRAICGNFFRLVFGFGFFRGYGFSRDNIDFLDLFFFFDRIFAVGNFDGVFGFSDCSSTSSAAVFSSATA